MRFYRRFHNQVLDATFTIPMRGNEALEAAADGEIFEFLFTIPMRGNELTREAGQSSISFGLRSP